DLPAGDAPAALDLAAAGPDRDEVGAGIGLAHADAEEDLATGDARQEALLLRLGADAQDERTALPVGDPVGGDGGARDQQFLGDDVALEAAPLVAAILARPGHADPAAGAEQPAEGDVGMGAEIAARRPGALG